MVEEGGRKEGGGEAGVGERGGQGPAAPVANGGKKGGGSQGTVTGGGSQGNVTGGSQGTVTGGSQGTVTGGSQGTVRRKTVEERRVADSVKVRMVVGHGCCTEVYWGVLDIMLKCKFSVLLCTEHNEVIWLQLLASTL